MHFQEQTLGALGPLMQGQSGAGCPQMASLPVCLHPPHLQHKHAQSRPRGSLTPSVVSEEMLQDAAQHLVSLQECLPSKALLAWQQCLPTRAPREAGGLSGPCPRVSAHVAGLDHCSQTGKLPPTWLPTAGQDASPTLWELPSFRQGHSQGFSGCCSERCGKHEWPPHPRHSLGNGRAVLPGCLYPGLVQENAP